MTPLRPHSIIHLSVHASGGGTESNLQALCAATPEFRHESLQRLMGGFPLPWKNLWRARGALRAMRPRAVFCYGVTAHLFAMFAFPWGVPLVGSIRGLIDFEGKKGWIRNLIKWRFACWVSNSRAALRGEKGIVIYNGVHEPPAGEAALYPDLKKPVYGMLASGNPVKGHDFMLQTWTKLAKPGTLVFAGKLGDDLKRRAEAAGVLCPGFVAPGPLLRSLDLLVVPSTSESMPTALLEAMVRGVPCLATPVGGIPELIVNDKTGFLRRREDWAEFLATLDWQRARHVGSVGQEHAQKEFSFDSMQRQFLEAARSVVARK